MLQGNTVVRMQTVTALNGDPDLSGLSIQEHVVVITVTSPYIISEQKRLMMKT